MSKIELVIFALAVLANECRSQQYPCNDGLKFVGDNVNEYGISRGLEKSLTAVTACFWMNIPASYVETHSPTILSYATSSYGDNELIIWVTSTLKVARRSIWAKSPDVVADGKDHHACVTWDLSSGWIKMYVDGIKKAKIFRPANILPAGGTWIIGQDQDRFEGGFAKKDSMKGVLAEVNVWDRILCSYEIVALAASCGPLMKGNVKAHNDFDIKGGVETFKPACCLGNLV